jgi:hypothetical protein
MKIILNYFLKRKGDELELSNIGSFDDFSFSQLSEKILMLNKGFTVKKENIDMGSFMGVFESPKTKLCILYNTDGKFISRKEEIWK